jgi:hypothetical protein
VLVVKKVAQRCEPAMGADCFGLIASVWISVPYKRRDAATDHGLRRGGGGGASQLAVRTSRNFTDTADTNGPAFVRFIKGHGLRE